MYGDDAALGNRTCVFWKKRTIRCWLQILHTSNRLISDLMCSNFGCALIVSQSIISSSFYIGTRITEITLPFPNIALLHSSVSEFYFILNDVMTFTLHKFTLVLDIIIDVQHLLIWHTFWSSSIFMSCAFFKKHYVLFSLSIFLTSPDH